MKYYKNGDDLFAVESEDSLTSTNGVVVLSPMNNFKRYPEFSFKGDDYFTISYPAYIQKVEITALEFWKLMADEELKAVEMLKELYTKHAGPILVPGYIANVRKCFEPFNGGVTLWYEKVLEKFNLKEEE